LWENLSPCFPFRVSFDPEDLRIKGNPFPSPAVGGIRTEGQGDPLSTLQRDVSFFLSPGGEDQGEGVSVLYSKPLILTFSYRSSTPA
jgi:hypothetical protein